jgi:DNA-binding IclR family transcriptional regulator
VRREKYATNNEEFVKGIRVIGVPVFSTEGVAYAMNLVVSSEEVSMSQLRRNYASKMIRTAKEVSETLGYKEH